ncbi:MAG: hypothetical protein M3P06_03835 [Acidobacteriota bacterium]|nr:hypothetical protein [Acidobacteriota bacterium]
MNTGLIAATLTIVFEGLVAFIGPDSGGKENKTHVAIVTARHHAAIMTLKEPGDSPKAIKLKEGDRIAFSVGSGIAATDTSFDERVPTMSDYIRSGDLDARVKRKEPLPNILLGDVVLSYVELPNGTLSAEDTLKHPAQFTKKNGTKEIRCPARIVRFTMTPEPTEPVRVTIEGRPPRRPLTRTLDLTYELTIENTTRHPGNHYNRFESLLESGGRLGFVSEITSQDCDKDGRVMDERETERHRRETEKHRRKTVSLRAPNGDCGPTDYP